MTIGNLVVKLSAETAKFHREMETVARRVERVARQITRAGREISTAVSLPIIAAGFLAFRAALEESHRAFGPLFQAFESLKAQVHDLWAAIGQALTPVFLQIIEVLRRVVDWVRGLVEAFNRLSPATKKIIVNVLLFLAVLGPAILILGKLVGVIAAIPTVLLALTSPIGLVVVAALALGAAALYVVTHWEKVKIRLLLFWMAIKEAFFDGVGAVLRVLQFLTGWIPGLGKAITKLKDNFDAFADRSLQKSVVQLQRLEAGLKDAAPAIQHHTELSLEARKALNDYAEAIRRLNVESEAMGPSFNKDAGRVAALQQLMQALVAAGIQANTVLNAQGLTLTKLAGTYQETQRRSQIFGEVLTSFGPRLADQARAIQEFGRLVAKGLDWEEAITRLQAEADQMQSITDTLKTGIVDALSVMGEQLGAIFSGAGTSFKKFGAAIFGVIGGVMKTLGGVLIAFGIAGLKIRTFFTNPIGAIAAGVALVALGSALAGAAQRSVESGLGGGGGAGGGSVAAAATPSTETAAAPATIIIEGGFLDMTDPRQADALANALETLTGRRVIIQAG